MATAGELQQDSASQKFQGPFDPADGTGKALRGANIDQTEGYADGQVALMDHNNANLDKADDAAVTLATVRVLPVGFLADDTTPDSVDEGDIGLPRMSLARIVRVAPGDDNGLNVYKADDAAFTIATSLVLPMGALADDTGPDSVDEGDVGIPRMSLSRVLRVAPGNDAGLNIHIADDAAFTVATSLVLPMGALADDTSPDSVDEGDVGIPRMSLSRVLRTAVGSDAGLNVVLADDAAFTVATSLVMPMGALADESSPDSVNEGDVGIPRMTTNRLLRVVDTDAAGNNRAYRAKATLMAEAIVTTDRTTNETGVSGFGGYKAIVVVLTLSAKTMDASTTFDVYVQTSPDDGTNWDDIIHFTQVTSAAMAAGTYKAVVVNALDAGIADGGAVLKDGTLTAANIVDYFCDQLRVKTVSVNFSGADTLTVKVEVVAIG